MQNNLSSKVACAYFFIIPALAFGILSGRLPAIKAILQLNNSQTGALLLGLGASTLSGLLIADLFIEKFGAKPVTSIAGFLLMLFITCAAACKSFTLMLCFLVLTGFCVGFCDVGMNALGIYLEKTTKTNCLAFLHGASSIGGACGAIAASCFSWLTLSPILNFSLVLGCFTLLFPLACRYTPKDAPTSGKKISLSLPSKIPFFLLLCGILSCLCHIIEGSTGEWGSILLTSVKGASQQTAALVFAVCTGAMIISRMLTDRLRCKISDRLLMTSGSLMSFLGLALVLLSPHPAICLAGYGIMGFGIGPVTPILFSRAGFVPNVTPGQASAVVSIFSYSGLLLFPPLFGMIGDAIGLMNALWIIAFMCIILALGGLPFKNILPLNVGNKHKEV